MGHFSDSAGVRCNFNDDSAITQEVAASCNLLHQCFCHPSERLLKVDAQDGSQYRFCFEDGFLVRATYKEPRKKGEDTWDWVNIKKGVEVPIDNFVWFFDYKDTYLGQPYLTIGLKNEKEI